MNRKKSFALALLLMLALSVVLPTAIFAADGANVEAVAEDAAAEATVISGKSYGSGIAIGLAAAGGAIAMGITVGKAAEGISRQPEASGEIRSSMMLGLVFIETAVIYALLVVILIIFVL